MFGFEFTVHYYTYALDVLRLVKSNLKGFSILAMADFTISEDVHIDRVAQTLVRSGAEFRPLYLCDGLTSDRLRGST